MYEEEMEEVVDKALFRIFGLQVTPYALFMVLGAVMALFLARRRARRVGVTGDAVLFFAMAAIPLGVVLGRAVFCLCRIVDVYDFGISYIFKLTYGGYSIMGVFAGVLLAAWLVRRLGLAAFTDVLDAVMPGLLIMLAMARFGEGSTMNGTGPEVSAAALQFMPLARRGMYGEYTYAVYMGEALTALIAGVYTQAMDRRPRGETAGTALIIVCAAQILWEGLRRDQVLKFDFMRWVMVVSALTLLTILLLSLRRLDWPLGGKALTLGGLFLLAGVVMAMEFFADGKVIQTIPLWVCYLCEALSVTGMGWLCLRTLRAACEV